MSEFYYVIRWDRCESYGDICGDIYQEQFGYLTDIKISSHARGCLFADSLDNVLEFGSWAEAAAMASFIIFHIDDFYEDALEVVKLSR